MSNSLGFHNLPFLAHRKSVKKGFEFTIMVVGECSIIIIIIIVIMYKILLYCYSLMHVHVRIQNPCLTL